MPMVAAAHHAVHSHGGSGGDRAASKQSNGSRRPSKDLGGGGNLRAGSKERNFIANLGKSNTMEDLEHILNDKDGDEFAGMVDKYSREVFHMAETLPAVVLMNEGQFDELTLPDVQELFKVLDADASGTLDFEEIELLLREVLEPPCTDEQIEAIYELTDKGEDHVISPLELYKALKGPVKHALKRAQKENTMLKEFAHKFGHDLQVDKPLLIDRLKWSVERDDAFRTLPFSLAYICIFSFLVVAHLRIWERHKQEESLDAWIEGYGKHLLGPYLGSVSSIDGMFDWLKHSGLPSVFGSCNINNATSGHFCKVGTRSILIGDAALKQSRRDGTERSEWLLLSEQAKTHLSATPGDYLGAAIQAAQHLHTSGWADSGTMDITLSFATAGVRSQLFTLTDVRTKFDDYGYALPTSSSSALFMSSYPRELVGRIGYLTVDALYFLFLFIPMLLELRDMIGRMRLSGAADGFWSYAGIWNCVDWVCITTGYSSIVVWYLCIQAVLADSIQSLILEQNEKMVLAPGIMGASGPVLEMFYEDSKSLIAQVSLLRVIVGLDACAILMKFFKAFQANPRLQVVTNTMVKAASDIFHFSIVFLAVFIGFAIVGHILFGNDLVQFRTFAGSLDTCFIVLMGDFGWYGRMSDSELELGSGLPYWVLGAWFWIYMIFVLMILLNMLLAIILDHYTELVNQIKLDIDVPTLWEQVFRYFAHRKQTKAHIPMKTLLTLLEDDDTPCHHQDSVSSHSLMEAFPEMTKDEAEHLIEWLRVEAKKKLHGGEDEVSARLKVMSDYIETITEDLKVVKLNTAVCSSRLKGRGAEISKVNAAPPIFTEDLADQFINQVDRLTLQIGGVIRDLTTRVGTATNDLSIKAAMQAEVAAAAAPQQRTLPGLPREDLLSVPADNSRAVRSLPACWSSEGLSVGKGISVDFCVTERAEQADF